MTKAQRLVERIRAHNRERAIAAHRMLNPPLIFGEPATIVRDSFNRPDAASLGNAETGQLWTATLQSWGIISGAAYRTDTNASRGAAAIPCNGADVDLEYVYTYGADNEQGEGTLRLTNSNNYITAGIERNSVTLGNVFIGSFQAAAWGGYVAQVANPWTIGQDYLIRIVANGTLISVFVNGVLLASGTIAFNQTATRHGIGAFRDAPAGAYVGRFKSLIIKRV